MSDDPAVWLVEEFGARTYDGAGGHQKYILISERESTNPMALVTYHVDDGVWQIIDEYTDQPLTRADVRRLCELFGVSRPERPST